MNKLTGMRVEFTADRFQRAGKNGLKRYVLPHFSGTIINHRWREISKLLSASLLLSAAFSSCTAPGEKNKSGDSDRPNIIVMMADDMGFSDIGCYGGEISTPNLDYLAENGIRYAQFYNAARCCPTRASLLSGVYPHQAGMGWMTNADLGTPAYQGDLSKNVATIAEVLKTAGYGTYMSGKWHVSGTRKNNGGLQDNWPAQRGFDRFFGIVGGAGNYFNLPVYSDNTKYRSPEDFYFTHAVSDSAVSFIDKHVQSLPDDPLFMYVAYTAPHWPLHALQEDIDKYRELYREGWDNIRQRRLKKQYEIGLWQDEVELSPRDEAVPAWDSFSQEKKEDFALRMAIYAAQIDAMDQGIGRIIDKLKETGQLDNTLIFFLSDNGGCAEYINGGESKDLTGDLEKTWQSYRIHWANASNTPFREYKHWVHEGGIRTPLVAHWPEGIKKSLNNSFVREYGHLTDIMATCVELAGATYPEEMNGNELVPLQGKSLVPHFSDDTNNRGPVFWEHEGNIGMRDGVWKLVAKTPENDQFDPASLELYNIQEDPTEINDLGGVFPEKLDSMYQAWDNWAHEVEVFPMDTREYNQRALYSKRRINGEFDVHFGDWNILNPGRLVDFEIDQDARISGPNSARMTVLEKGTQAEDAALAWIFPVDESEQVDISFRAVAEKETTLHVFFDFAENKKNKVFSQTYTVDDEVQEFSFHAGELTRPGRYRLVFGLGNNPAGDKIWLDAVTLEVTEP